jgi:ADP-heptose:LPS heptosyltransferase
VSEEHLPLLEDALPELKIIPCDFNKFKSNIIYKIKIISFLQKKGFALVLNISPERGIINDEISILAGGDRIVGLKNKSLFIPKLIISHLNRYYSSFLNSKSINQYAILSELLESLGIELQNNEPVLKTECIIPEFTNENFIAIAPLASVAFRSWPVSEYAELCRKISELINIVLLGTKGQYHMLEKIKSGNDRIFNYAGKSHIREIPAIIMKSKLFIGNDSGLTHIAAQLRKPLIGIIGGGKFGEFFPYKENSKSIYKYYEMNCFNCKWNCIYNEPYCINKISNDEIFEDAVKLMRLD